MSTPSIVASALPVSLAPLLGQTAPTEPPAEPAPATPPAGGAAQAPGAPPPSTPPEVVEPVVPEVPVTPPSDFPGNLEVGDWIGIGGIGLLALLMILALRKVMRRRKPEAPGKPAELERRELPAPAPLPRIELPKSEKEAARLEEADRAHREAEALAQQRQAMLEDARRAGDVEALSRAEAEAKALKDREQELKREEYRAKKEAEEEARERRRREKQEAERLRLEEEARLRAEEEARLEAAAALERQKVQREAGQTLAQGLDKTRSQGFMARINSFLGQSREVDESVLGELEEILFTADIGVRTASHLVEVAREKVKKNELSNSDRIKTIIRDEVAKIVDLPTPRSMEGGGPPHVVMVVGVNGAGKTTTIGKLAAQLTSQGKKVVLAAGDTFRAAATEQLDVWADRANAELVRGVEGADPSSVIFEAIQKAKSLGADVVLADTAGRLHTRAPLMEELKKVRRVMDKALPGAPHEVLLVLDSTNGQNAIQQARQFHESVAVTSIALTKLDGTAKGGVVIGICDELKLPVVWVGVGEKVADLRRFDPREFVDALFE